MIAPRPLPRLERKASHQKVDYFLLVSLKLALESVAEFYELAGPVLATIQAVEGLTLIAAGESPPRTELFHVWRLQSPDDLREAMIRLADNPAYGKMDKLILDERQDIVTPFGLVPNPRPPVPSGNTYLRITGHLESKNLAEFQAENEVVSPSLKRAGWQLWGAFLNLTGRLNTITSVWAIDKEKGLSSVDFKGVPGLSLLSDVSVDQWTATEYQPRGRQ